MDLRKFPVTSKNGVEYLVKIKPTYLEHFAIGVYVEMTGLFGRKRMKLVNGDNLEGAPWYFGPKHNYDFIKMAKAEIERIENEAQEELARKEAIKANIAKFNEWDGDLS